MPSDLVHTLSQLLYDKKAKNILALDIRQSQGMTDEVLIAEGFVEQHVRTLAKTIIEFLDKKGIKPAHIEGLKQGDWVVIDCLNLVVHLFMPGLREHYQLELLWPESQLIELKLEESPAFFLAKGKSLKY